MKIVTAILHARPLLWLLLAIPAFPLVWDLIERARYYPELMHITGVWSVQLLVLTLAITPVSLVFRRVEALKPVAQWFLIRRRYFGVASFGYGLLHLIFYIRQTVSLELILLEALDIAFLVGWIGIIMMVLLAVTSNDYSVKRMGKGWKTLQRFAYPAAAAILLHWFYFDEFWDQVIFWTGLLIAFKLAHVALRYGLKPKMRKVAT